MKKVLSLLIIGAICLGFGACAKEENIPTNPVMVKPQEETRDVFEGAEYMEIGKNYVVTNSLDVTLKSIKTTDVIEPMMYADYSYENDKEDMVFVDVVFEVENVGESEIKGQSIAVIEAKNSDGLIYNESKFFLEYDNYTSLAEHTTLKGKEKTLFHAVVYVPQNEKNVTLNVRFNNAQLLYDYILGEEIKSTVWIYKGEEIASGDKKMFVTGVRFENELHPSQPGQKTYTYYKSKNANSTYMIVETVLTNSTDTYMNAYDFAKLDVFCNTEALPGGMWVCEKPTGEAFSEDCLIPAKSTVKAYYVYEIPQTDIRKVYNLKMIFELEEYWCKL
ncbi:MAG: hypothetical protein IJ316_00185 [Clostridia bacterium]|nr:hypothetical protein [Clostridia bacterium]